MAGLVLLIATNSSVAAHVLLTDDASNSSAILHIVPDDDPVAGQDATIDFTIRVRNTPHNPEAYRLYITDEQNQTVDLTMKAQADSIGTHYTFPAQGLYRLELKRPEASMGSIDFKYSLRVSRGGTTTYNTQPPAWAQPLLIGAAVAGILLVMVFVNNAKAIFKQNK